MKRLTRNKKGRAQTHRHTMKLLFCVTPQCPLVVAHCHTHLVQTRVGRRSAGDQATDLGTHAGTVWEVMRLFSQREGGNVTAAASAASTDRQVPKVHAGT